MSGNTRSLEGSQSTPTKSCRACSLAIPSDARLCSHCGTRQNWTAIFRISSAVLTALVALISVITLALPYWQSYLPKTAKPILINGRLQEKTWLIIVGNKGNIPLVVQKAAACFEKNCGGVHDLNGVGHVRFDLTSSGSDLTVKPGQLSTFSLSLRQQRLGQDEALDEAGLKGMRGQGLVECTIVIFTDDLEGHFRQTPVVVHPSFCRNFAGLNATPPSGA
jgi:hypothetical protein